MTSHSPASAPTTAESTDSPDTDRTTEQGGQQGLPAAKPPLRTAAAVTIGILLALLLLGIAVVAIEEAVIRTGLWDGPSWTRNAVTAVDNVAVEPWMAAPLIACWVLGLVLLIVALKPRRRKGSALQAQTGVYLRRKDLARLAIPALQHIDGLTDLSAKAKRRILHISVTTLTGKDQDTAIKTELKDRLAPILATLERPPKIAVTINHQDHP